MTSLTDLEGTLPLKVLQIGCGSFGVHLKNHLTPKVTHLSLLGRDDPEPDFKQFDYIFLATDDSSLKPLIQEIRLVSPVTPIIHFSGFYYFESALGLHPVASFNKESEYDLDQVTFVADGDLPLSLKKIFPKVKFIDPSKKKDYHSFLSVTANAFQLMAHNIGKDFESLLDIKSDLLKEIVVQSLETESIKGEKSFSGPWVRGEKKDQDEKVDQMQSKSLKNLNEVFKKEIKIFRDRESSINKKTVNNLKGGSL